MSNDRKFYCPDLDRWFDSMYELNEAVFGDMKWPSAEEEREMIRRANISAGKKGKPCSADTRAKIGAIKMGKTGKTRSAEARANMSAAHKGKPPGNKGKTRSAEARANMSAAHKGKSHSAESRAKMSAAKKGKTHSEETKEKLRQAQARRRAAELAAAQALTSDGSVS